MTVRQLQIERHPVRLGELHPPTGAGAGRLALSVLVLPADDGHGGLEGLDGLAHVPPLLLDLGVDQVEDGVVADLGRSMG